MESDHDDAEHGQVEALIEGEEWMMNDDINSAQKVLDSSFDDELFPKQKVDVIELDITDSSSIQNVSDYINSAYNASINVLVNNAGIAFRAKQFNENIVKKTIDTNFYGTVNITKALSPFVSDRILFVSSRSGALQQYSKERQRQFLKEDLSEKELVEMVEAFKADSKHLMHADCDQEIEIEAKGWTLNAYNLSKASISMYSRILAKDLFERQRRRVFVGAYCPGLCQTEMTRNEGERSAVEGAYGLTTMCSMLVDHEEEQQKRDKLKLSEQELVPF